MNYLILHKVRGQPAFDVAEKAIIGDEEGWIVGSSGHRAYPYRYWPLDSNQFPMEGLPPEWPDHYTVSEAPAKKGKGQAIDPSIINALLNSTVRLKRRI